VQSPFEGCPAAEAGALSFSGETQGSTKMSSLQVVPKLAGNSSAAGASLCLQLLCPEN